MPEKRNKNPSCLDGAQKTGAGPLGATVGSFANRLKRRLHEQAVLDSKILRAHEERKVLMMESMQTIRKALMDIRRIDLGERFRFEIEVTDWEGWPRVEVMLIDSIAPQKIDYGLLVSAHDSRERGIININSRSGSSLGRIFFDSPQEAARLPLVLKKALRAFLDTVGNYVLNPIPAEQLVDYQTKPIEMREFDMVGEKLRHEEVFSEDILDQDRNRVSENEEAAPLDPAYPPKQCRD